MVALVRVDNNNGVGSIDGAISIIIDGAIDGSIEGYIDGSTDGAISMLFESLEVLCGVRDHIGLFGSSQSNRCKRMMHSFHNYKKEMREMHHGECCVLN